MDLGWPKMQAQLTVGTKEDIYQAKPFHCLQINFGSIYISRALRKQKTTPVEMIQNEAESQSGKSNERKVKDL